MEYAALEVERIYILRVDPGEDVLASVNRFIAETGLRQAVVLGGYGTLTSYHLHWVKHDRLPSEQVLGQGQGGIEILAMSGTVVEGEPHIHVTLSTPAGAYGGHLHEGSTAYVLCEVFFAQVAGRELRRERIPVDVPGMGVGTVSRLFFGPSAG
jgi:predicted DNA-binding protein with PD1-like motif